MDVYQDKYDDETEGSTNGEQQRLWSAKINKQIEELDEYSETTLKFGFKKK